MTPELVTIEDQESHASHRHTVRGQRGSDQRGPDQRGLRVLLLSVKGLTTGYGTNKSVLDSVDLPVPDGRIVAVLGSNGAGKSTLLRAISGTLPMHGGALYAGTIELDGVEIHKLKPAAVTRAGVVQSLRDVRSSVG